MGPWDSSGVASKPSLNNRGVFLGKSMGEPIWHQIKGSIKVNEYLFYLINLLIEIDESTRRRGEGGKAMAATRRTRYSSLASEATPLLSHSALLPVEMSSSSHPAGGRRTVFLGVDVGTGSARAGSEFSPFIFICIFS